MVVANRGDSLEELGAKRVLAGSYGVVDPFAVSPLSNQPSLTEGCQVLGYVVLGYLQSVCEFAAAELLVARQQEMNDPQPGLIGESAER